MKPTKEQLERLRKIQRKRDDETYHVEFDTLLEEKLMELDPEWMKAMLEEYNKSEIARWYA